ncbi:Putative ICEF Integrative Conjugal Element-II [Mycoplasmopsis columboralis]|uniref:ICEF Integrative Conjugal Element-II n=1 Tax=Mycoplasmopsis columboralis TaxID=171282 RepID=A0A449B6L5_9BACT|nr:hypothetical protein [Mycoplasmopsis columboralis]VEU76246.1 Putative ICEF Integrative Conjugal Element-II [Mycoplasmopsis columboralis]
MTNIKATTNEIRSVLKKHKQQKEISIRYSGRFRSIEDANLFNNFKNKVQRSGESLNTVLNDIIISHIKREQENVYLDSIKERMHYYFRKAVYVQTKPLNDKIKAYSEHQNKQIDLLNKKLTAIMKILFTKIDPNDVNLDDLNSEIYIDDLAFKQARNDLYLELNEKLKVITIKDNQVDQKLNQTYKDVLDTQNNNFALKEFYENKDKMN